jgi:hypothetical protein
MAILSNQKVLTLDYWKPAHDLKVGDYVFDKEGNIVQIKVVQQYRATECYEVFFDDHLSVQGDHNLAFWTENTKYRFQTRIYKNKRQFKRPLRTMTAQELSTASLKNKYNRSAYSVPTTKPLNLPEQTLPVPPFVFGFWYFNRRSNKRLAAPPAYAPQVYAQMQDHGYKVTEHRKLRTGGQEFSTKPKIEAHLIPNLPFRIPNNYLLASAEQRLALLRGILHAKSKTYIKSGDRFRFSDVHYSTILQVQGLIESLGHKTTVNFDDRFNYYSIGFKSRLKLVDDQRSPPIKVHHSRRYIKKVERLPEQLCVHIETNGKDNSFLVGEGFIACH